MLLDGLGVRAIAHEWATRWVGAKIVKIYQPYPRELRLLLRARSGHTTLLLSCDPQLPRLYTTDAEHAENPTQPPRFCQLLRKYLEGGELLGVQQEGVERMVSLLIGHTDTLGDDHVWRLVIEVMGRRSNAILVDEQNGRIIDALVRVSGTQWSDRQLVPGATFTPAPPLPGPSLLEATSVQMEPIVAQAIALQEQGIDAIAKHFAHALPGWSPYTATQFIQMHPNPDEWRQALLALQAQVRQHRYVPAVAFQQTQAIGLSPIGIAPQTRIQIFTFSTMNEAAARYFEAAARQRAIAQKAGELLAVVKTARARLQRKIEKLDESLHEAEEAQRLQRMGELILAHLPEIPAGAQRVSLIDDYTGKPIEIPLDPTLRPTQMAQQYFKQYAKAKRTLRYAQEQREKAQQELAYLESVAVALQESSPTAIDEIREELEEEGYLKRSKQKRRPQPVRPASVQLESGAQLMWGRNNRQNEQLSLHIAKPNDLWFHLRGYPGAHVLLRGPATPEDRRLAAMLCAYLSGVHTGKADVDLTQARYIHKSPAQRTGLVLYDHEESLTVEVDPASVLRLLEQAEQQRTRTNGPASATKDRPPTEPVPNVRP